MSVGEICNRDVLVAQPSTPVAEAARLMREYHSGTVVVVEDKGAQRVPVGIVTDRDIVVELTAKGVASDALAVGDLMGAELMTAQEEEGIWELIRRMRSRGVRRVPVVNRDGGLEGIVTVDDLLELLADELAGLAAIVAREQARERKTRR
jgi:CBS domain-containing protein